MSLGVVSPISNIKLSIMIPTCNRPESLEQLLKQILSQYLPQHTEIIISENSIDAKYSRELDEILKNSYIQYIRQPVNIGLLNNAKFLRERARGYYHCMLHDDDLLSDEYFKNLIEYLDAHPECIMAMPVGVRHYNRCFWYKYEEYNSNIGSVYENIKDLIDRMRGSIWSIEHSYYSVYRAKLGTMTLDCGRPGAIFAHLVRSHLSGSVASINSCSITKNTTYKDLEKYCEAAYFRFSALEIFGRKFALKVQTRLIISISLVSLIIGSDGLTLFERAKLFLKIAGRQVSGDQDRRWSVPLLEECNEIRARENPEVWASYFSEEKSGEA